MFKPGVVARRFVDGKRKVYLHPAQYYLFTSIIFFFIFSFTVRKADNQVSQQISGGLQRIENGIFTDTLNELDEVVTTGVESIDSFADGVGYIQTIEGLDSLKHKNSYTIKIWDTEVLDSLIAHAAPESEKLKALGLTDDAGKFRKRMYQQFLKLYERKGGGIVKTLFDTLPIAMFFMLPMFAFLVMMFYRKKGLLAHHFVFSFYFFTFLFTIFSVLSVANMLFAVPGWLNIIVLLFCILYLILALRYFYQSKWMGVLIRALFITLIYTAIVIPIASVAIVFISFLIY